ncbi:MAG: hypothetical protein CW336_05245 [Bacteroidetes bacterium]|nr:hypothetical protein [Bacteroidota bacterium]
MHKNMRKLFIILLLCLITQTLLCQISSIKFAENQTPEDIPLYDSIEVKDIRSLVGQTLFLKPTQKAIGNGYYTTVLKTGITTNANVYMPDHTYSCFTSLDAAGKYFNVIDYLEIRKNSKSIDKFFKMVETQSFDTVYLSVDYIKFTRLCDFLIVGNYIKCKQLYIGKDFVFKDFSRIVAPIFALSNGQKIETAIPVNTEFHCTDVSFIENEYYDMVCVLHNEEYGDIYIIEYAFKNQFQPKDEYLEVLNKEKQRKKQIIAKYGQHNGQLILNKKVELGFTKEMCIESWGKPYDINTTRGLWGVSEQWCYSDGRYLYFENEILTSVQE